jgi:chemotaxis protein MotB
MADPGKELQPEQHELPPELQGGGGHGGGADRWLVSYADFITVLLVLFIVLYSMANVDKNKFQQVAKSLARALGGGHTVIVVQGGSGRSGANFVDPNTLKSTITLPTEPESRGETAGTNPDPLTHLGEVLGPQLKEAVGDQVRLFVSPKGLRVSLIGNALFDSGKAEIKPEAARLLQAIAAELKRGNYYASVEGSADNQPIRTAQFRDNWDLASARALNVLHYLAELGVAQERLYLASYGEYHPIGDNTTAAGRQMNRRVDIVIMEKPVDLDLGREITPGTTQSGQ